MSRRYRLYSHFSAGVFCNISNDFGKKMCITGFLSNHVPAALIAASPFQPEGAALTADRSVLTRCRAMLIMEASFCFGVMPDTGKPPFMARSTGLPFSLLGPFDLIPELLGKKRHEAGDGIAGGETLLLATDATAIAR